MGKDTNFDRFRVDFLGRDSWNEWVRYPLLGGKGEKFTSLLTTHLAYMKGRCEENSTIPRSPFYDLKIDVLREDTGEYEFAALCLLRIEHATVLIDYCFQSHARSHPDSPSIDLKELLSCVYHFLHKKRKKGETPDFQEIVIGNTCDTYWKKRATSLNMFTVESELVKA